MKRSLSILTGVLAIVGATASAAQAQYRQPGSGYPSIRRADRDPLGRPTVPGGNNDPLQQPLFPGAGIDSTGRPLAPAAGRDPFGRPALPGQVGVQPTLPQLPRPPFNEREEKERRPELGGTPHISAYIPHIPVHWHGGSATKFMSPSTLKVKPPSASVRPTGSWWGKGILAGIGGAVAALFGALWRRKQE
jgi:hypothetical protein